MGVLKEPASPPGRVVLFGSEGGFSLPLLLRLLAKGVSIAAVVMPGVAVRQRTGPQFPVAVEQPEHRFGLAGFAAARGVPVLRVTNIHDHRLVQVLSMLAADVLLIACFPFKLPATLWQAPRLICWNLHPSLLPLYRGPAPMFWQLRCRETNTGVTLHELSDHLDAGNIVAQRAFPLPATTGVVELDEWVAECGVKLFMEALEQQRRGCVTATPQDELAASYYPGPSERVA